MRVCTEKKGKRRTTQRGQHWRIKTRRKIEARDRWSDREKYNLIEARGRSRPLKGPCCLAHASLHPCNGLSLLNSRLEPNLAAFRLWVHCTKISTDLGDGLELSTSRACKSLNHKTSRGPGHYFMSTGLVNLTLTFQRRHRLHFTCGAWCDAFRKQPVH